MTTEKRATMSIAPCPSPLSVSSPSHQGTSTAAAASSSQRERRYDPSAMMDTATLMQTYEGLVTERDFYEGKVEGESASARRLATALCAPRGTARGRRRRCAR